MQQPRGILQKYVFQLFVNFEKRDLEPLRFRVFLNNFPGFIKLHPYLKQVFSEVGIYCEVWKPKQVYN